VSNQRIVGIVLVRDEDIHVEQAVRNILGFCDRILIADHQSRDGTWAIAQRLSKECEKVTCTRIRHPSESHTMIQAYAGTSTWVFGVDGDELYDPRGLSRFRQALLAGQFDGWWTIFGNVLNCTSLDRERGEATGYLAPPCRSVTKLYNFNAISGWDGPCPERLHGGAPIFRPGFDAGQRHNLYMELPWEDAIFRCLHTCFLRRSSRDRRSRIRPNIVELNEHGWWSRLSLGVRLPFGRWVSDSWKRERYMRGDRVIKDVSAFFAAPAVGTR
jgi:hypothetical protein